MKISLYPYQVDALWDSVRNNHLINFDCGLGKTVTAIELGQMFLEKGLLAQSNPDHRSRVLVVAPKRLVPQWAKMIHDQTNRGVTHIPTGIAFKPELLVGWNITHYEVLTSGAGKMLRKAQWDALVADEVHYVCNRNAKRTIALKSFKAFRKVGLTATPMDKSPDELWSILNWFDSGRWRSYWNFVNKYCDAEVLDPWRTHARVPVKTITGPKESALPQLAEEIKPYFTRITKAQAAPWLPKYIEQFIPVEMDRKQMKAYLAVQNADDIEVDVSIDERNVSMFIPNVLARITKLQQITSGAIEGLPSVKVQWAYEYYKNNPLEAMIFFTRFVHTARVLSNLLGCEIVTQGSGLPTDFIEGRSRAVVGTIDAMGEGIDGLQRATTEVFVDQHWSSRKMTQAVSRIHRLGITEPKNVVYLYCPATYDPMVLKSFKDKWTTQQLVYRYFDEAKETTYDHRYYEG